MKILITGCCGFIGTNLTLYFLKNTNHEIIGIDNFLDNYDIKFKENNLISLMYHPNFEFHRENILDYKFKKVDKVIHLAAIPGVRKSINEPLLYLENNLKTFIYILEECKKLGIKDIIYASSSSVYGNNKKVPFSEEDSLNNIRSSYACSKRCMEIYANYYKDVFDMNITGLRFFTVYGPRGRPDMAPYIFLKNIAEEKEIIQYGDGKTMRDYTYIDDIIDGIVSIINEKGEKEKIYNLGNNNPISLNDFISLIEKITNKKAIKNIKEIPLGDVEKTYADLKKSKKDLNYNPKISLEEGLVKTYRWMLEYKYIKL
jgi:UDP-glucuronate 4-epimerase